MRTPAFGFADVPEGNTITGQDAADQFVVLCFSHVPSQGFPRMAAATDTHDEARVGVGGAIGACYEVVRLQNDTWRVGEAVAVSYIAQ